MRLTREGAPPAFPNAVGVEMPDATVWLDLNPDRGPIPVQIDDEDGWVWAGCPATAAIEAEAVETYYQLTGRITPRPRTAGFSHLIAALREVGGEEWAHGDEGCSNHKPDECGDHKDEVRLVVAMRALAARVGVAGFDCPPSFVRAADELLSDK